MLYIKGKDIRLNLKSKISPKKMFIITSQDWMIRKQVPPPVAYSQNLTLHLKKRRKPINYNKFLLQHTSTNYETIFLLKGRELPAQ